VTKQHKGVIYILTNPSFPEYVKIGYLDYQLYPNTSHIHPYMCG